MRLLCFVVALVFQPMRSKTDCILYAWVLPCFEHVMDNNYWTLLVRDNFWYSLLVINNYWLLTKSKWFLPLKCRQIITVSLGFILRSVLCTLISVGCIYLIIYPCTMRSFCHWKKAPKIEVHIIQRILSFKLMSLIIMQGKLIHLICQYMVIVFFFCKL